MAAQRGQAIREFGDLRLFAWSLGKINDVDPGFDPTAVLLARIEFDDLTRDPARNAPTVVEMQQRLEQARNVESVGVSTVVPLSLENEEFDVLIDGSSTDPQRVRVMANRRTPGWFQTVRISLLAGRDFTWKDRAGVPDVAIVNETFASESGTAMQSATAYARFSAMSGLSGLFETASIGHLARRSSRQSICPSSSITFDTSHST